MLRCADCKYKPPVFNHRPGTGCSHPFWNPTLSKPCPVERGLITEEEARYVNKLKKEFHKRMRKE